MKRHIIGDVPPIDGHMTFAVPVIVRLVVQRVLEWLGTAPGITEVIFRASAEGGRELLAIHKKLFITFSPPTAARIPNVEHHAHKPSGALRLEYGPIDVALRLSREESVAMPLCMKSPKALHRLGEGSMNDFKTCHARLHAFIDQLHSRLPCKRHVPRAIPPPIFGMSERQRTINICTRRGAEEITQRRPNAWLALVIPLDLQGHLSERIAVIGGRWQIQLQAKACDGTWTFYCRYHGSFPRIQDAIFLAQHFLIGASAGRLPGAAVSEDFIGAVKRSRFFRAQLPFERGNLCALRKSSVSEMVILTPIGICDNFAGFPVRDGRVVIPTHRDGMDNRRPREGRILPIEISHEWQVNGWIVRPIQVDSDMALARGRRPDAPDAAWAFHFREDKFVSFLANVTTAISIRIPFEIFPTGLIISTGAIITDR